MTKDRSEAFTLNISEKPGVPPTTSSPIIADPTPPSTLSIMTINTKRTTKVRFAEKTKEPSHRSKSEYKRETRTYKAGPHAARKGSLGFLNTSGPKGLAFEPRYPPWKVDENDAEDVSNLEAYIWLCDRDDKIINQWHLNAEKKRKRKIGCVMQ